MAEEVEKMINEEKGKEATGIVEAEKKRKKKEEISLRAFAVVSRKVWR